MSEWRKVGNTAVITGGASGIGLAAAERLAAGGMSVLIADKNEDALKGARERIEAVATDGARVSARACDVSDLANVEQLRDAAFDEFGAVHCLMNNAGLGMPVGAPWENRAELTTMLGVNLWGVINGCQAFIPKMLESEKPGAVINTGSKQGITKPPGNYAYNLSKAGVLAYTESVAHAFATMKDCRLTAHLLVPGFVYSGMVSRFLPEKPPSAWTPEETVDFMLPRVEAGDFYVLCPDNDVTREMDEKRIQWSADDLIKNRPALSRWHPDFEEEFEKYMS